MVGSSGGRAYWITAYGINTRHFTSGQFRWLSQSTTAQ
nr:MAG TPA: hypothetical protein [Caudoviricetes sp.]